MDSKSSELPGSWQVRVCVGWVRVGGGNIYYAALGSIILFIMLWPTGDKRLPTN